MGELGKSNVITMVLIKGRQEGQSQRRRCDGGSREWRKRDRERHRK